MKSNKKAITGFTVIAALILASGCSSKSSTESESSFQSSSSKNDNKNKKKAVSNQASSSSHRTSEDKEEQKENSTTVKSGKEKLQKTEQFSQSTPRTQNGSPRWNSDKNRRLSDFMSKWQTEMKQSYSGTYDGAKVAHYGLKFPDALINKSNVKIKLNNQPVNLTWSSNGNNGAEYQVVSAATINSNAEMGKVTYLFTLHNGKPEVYYSRTANGNVFNLHDTKNTALQTGFANIVNN